MINLKSKAVDAVDRILDVLDRAAEILGVVVISAVVGIALCGAGWAIIRAIGRAFGFEWG